MMIIVKDEKDESSKKKLDTNNRMTDSDAESK